MIGILVTESRCAILPLTFTNVKLVHHLGYICLGMKRQINLENSSGISYAPNLIFIWAPLIWKVGMSPVLYHVHIVQCFFVYRSYTLRVTWQKNHYNLSLDIHQVAKYQKEDKIQSHKILFFSFFVSSLDPKNPWDCIFYYRRNEYNNWNIF
jgi:hypothetical protein